MTVCHRELIVWLWPTLSKFCSSRRVWAKDWTYEYVCTVNQNFKHYTHTTFYNSSLGFYFCIWIAVYKEIFVANIEPSNNTCSRGNVIGHEKYPHRVYCYSIALDPGGKGCSIFSSTCRVCVTKQNKIPNSNNTYCGYGRLVTKFCYEWLR